MKEVTEGAIGKSLPGLIIVPSNILRVGHCHPISQTLSSYFTDGDSGTERLGDLPKVTQQGGNSARS